MLFLDLDFVPLVEEMVDFLKGKIAKWSMPYAVLITDEIPLTATGKIKKITLRQQYKDCLSE